MSRVNGRGADHVGPSLPAQPRKVITKWVSRARALRASLPVDLITHDRQRRAPYAGPIGCALSAKLGLNQLSTLITWAADETGYGTGLRFLAVGRV